VSGGNAHNATTSTNAATPMPAINRLRRENNSMRTPLVIFDFLPDVFLQDNASHTRREGQVKTNWIAGQLKRT
jgi:hypothetical protein